MTTNELEMIAERVAIARGWSTLATRGNCYRLAWRRGFVAGYETRDPLNPYRREQWRTIWALGWKTGYEEQA